MADEASQKISMARDLAGMLAALERQLANDADPDDPPASGGTAKENDEAAPDDPRGGGGDSHLGIAAEMRSWRSVIPTAYHSLQSPC